MIAESSTALVDLLAHLRETIGVYIAERRAAGASANHVLGEMRCLVAEAEGCEGVVPPSEGLMRCVLAWAEEAYAEV